MQVVRASLHFEELVEISTARIFFTVFDIDGENRVLFGKDSCSDKFLATYNWSSLNSKCRIHGQRYNSLRQCLYYWLPTYELELSGIFLYKQRWPELSIFITGLSNLFCTHLCLILERVLLAFCQFFARYLEFVDWVSEICHLYAHAHCCHPPTCNTYFQKHFFLSQCCQKCEVRQSNRISSLCHNSSSTLFVPLHKRSVHFKLVNIHFRYIVITKCHK